MKNNEKYILINSNGRCNNDYNKLLLKEGFEYEILGSPVHKSPQFFLHTPDIVVRNGYKNRERLALVKPIRPTLPNSDFSWEHVQVLKVLSEDETCKLVGIKKKVHKNCVIFEYKDANKFSCLIKFDNDGRLLHERLYGREEKITYNNQGKILTDDLTSPWGVCRIKNRYDKHGNRISFENMPYPCPCHTIKKTFTYDNRNRVISEKTQIGDWSNVIRYNRDGNTLVYSELRDGCMETFTVKTDDKGNVIYKKEFDWETFLDYDEFNNVIHEHHTHVKGTILERWYRYDIRGNIIYKNDDGNETWCSYDKYNNKIFSKHKPKRIEDERFADEYYVKITPIRS